MDIEIEQKDKEVEILESKIGLADSKDIEEMKKQELNKKSSKRKGDRILDRLNTSLNKHNYF